VAKAARAEKRRGGVFWLTKRADFLAAAKGRRAHAPAFTLQAVARPSLDGALCEPRYGLTATRKIGGAVERNRMKRRLREALRLLAKRDAASLGRSGHDYVFVLRGEALALSFDALGLQLRECFQRVHAPRASGPGAKGRKDHKPRRPDGSAAATDETRA
jgi:ribonuclease P protein component